MRRFRTRQTKLKRTLQLKPPGTAPETLVADPTMPKPIIRIIKYGGSNNVDLENATIEDIRRLRALGGRMWVNVDGLGDADSVRQIGEIFGLHKLALEDVLATHQRAKIDDFETNLFIVLREPLRGDRLDTDQIGIFLGADFVVTFQEKHGDCFRAIRERLKANRTKMCSAGPDHLVYAIIDAIVDAYFPILEHYGEVLETLEDETVKNPSRKVVHEIHEIKRELLIVRRAIWPAREALGMLLREETLLISDDTRMYLRDAYDHLVNLIDMLENFRELGSDLMDIYLSSQSHRLGEVMKVLTIIATIFMPLTFIAGVYGMNFDTNKPMNMPELHWPFGYVFALSIMAASTLGMLAWFYRRGWIGRD